ncbi:MAG: PTS sugar transporter subunit IIA [Coriobacteriales bacterium]
MTYLSTQLQGLDDIISIERTCRPDEVPELDSDDIDMIISYVPVGSREIPVYRINHMVLDEEDLSAIRAFAMQVLDTSEQRIACEDEARQVHFLENEQSLVSPYTIALDATVEDWEGAVEEAGRLLFETGAITRAYIDAMIGNTRVNYRHLILTDGVIVSYADKEMGVIEEGVSFVRLATPVMFPGGRQIRFVLGLSLLNSDNINRIIYNIINLFTSEETRGMLEGAEKPEEVYRLLCNKV